MPTKPTWFARLDSIIHSLNSLPHPWVDRATLQSLLQVGPRRTQQILQPCIAHQLGSNGLAERNQLVAHLRQLGAAGAADYERQRRRKFLTMLDGWHRDRRSHPKLQVEAAHDVITQQFHELPAGIEIGAGTVTIRFERPHEALEKLLALAMAIGNDYEGFEHRARIGLPNEESSAR